MTDDPFNLARFVSAQAQTYEHALAELRDGRKRSHWMWFVFPQVAGLGHSSLAQHYGISSLAEARAYLAHPVLGPRLREVSSVVAALPAGPEAIFGSIDAMKLRSSMTLFDRAAPEEPVFAQVLAKYYGGEPDQATLSRL
jgi:uncharacterized protein (DUF1810 family)